MTPSERAALAAPCNCGGPVYYKGQKSKPQHVDGCSVYAWPDIAAQICAAEREAVLREREASGKIFRAIELNIDGLHGLTHKQRTKDALAAIKKHCREAIRASLAP